MEDIYCQKCIVCDDTFNIQLGAVGKELLCPNCKAVLRAFVNVRRADPEGFMITTTPAHIKDLSGCRTSVNREDAARYWLVGAEVDPVDPPEIQIPCPKCINSTDGEICDWGDYNLSYEQLPQCPKFKEK